MTGDGFSLDMHTWVPGLKGRGKKSSALDIEPNFFPRDQWNFIHFGKKGERMMLIHDCITFDFLFIAIYRQDWKFSPKYMLAFASKHILPDFSGGDPYPTTYLPPPLCEDQYMNFVSSVLCNCVSPS